MALPHLLAVGATLGVLQGEDLELKLRLDATTAMQTIMRGDAESALRYMAKFPGVNIGFLSDVVSSKDIRCSMSHIPTGDNTADLFTKPLPAAPFSKHRRGLGILSHDEALVLVKGKQSR